MVLKQKKNQERGVLGWREWVSLPDLGIERIKAKVDTGARTSTLHAFSLHPFVVNNQKRIRFDMNPLQHNTQTVITCEADVVDLRWVTDSGGHSEERYVIRTPIVIDRHSWSIEITLTERDTMLFRMLLARNAIRGRFVVDPARSFLKSKRKQISL
ncbi:MAG TPA: RimK/LysX family protein [Gammaproteobacteria bacterium]|nr:RimK/LysX family protein [Gammaproteobacteria bacterium]